MNGNPLIPSVVSFSSHERNRMIQSILDEPPIYSAACGAKGCAARTGGYKQTHLVSHRNTVAARLCRAIIAQQSCAPATERSVDGAQRNPGRSGYDVRYGSIPRHTKPAHFPPRDRLPVGAGHARDRRAANHRIGAPDRELPVAGMARSRTRIRIFAGRVKGSRNPPDVGHGRLRRNALRLLRPTAR